jgi:hypothetical protein
MAKQRRRSAAEWGALVREWQRSGWSAAGFAAARGLCVRTLLWWRSRLKRRGRDRQVASAQRALQLVPVRVEGEPQDAPGATEPSVAWEVVAPTGHVLRVVEQGAAPVLREALVAVARVGRRR